MNDKKPAAARTPQQKAAMQKAMQAKAAQQKAAQAKAGQASPAQRAAQQKAAQAKAAASKAPQGKPAPKKPAAPAGNKLAKRGILKFNITDEKQLYLYYMPFIKGCGIFMPTEDEHNIGDEAFLLLNLPDGKSKFSASAKVVWINPKQKLGKREPGIGLQISGRDAERMRAAIEEILGKKASSPLPTATM